MNDTIPMQIKDVISLAKSLEVVDQHSVMSDAVFKLEYWDKVFSDRKRDLGSMNVSPVRVKDKGELGRRDVCLRSVHRERNVGVRVRKYRERLPVRDVSEITEDLLGSSPDVCGVVGDFVEAELKLKIYLNNVSFVEIDAGDGMNMEVVFENAYEMFGLNQDRKNMYTLSLWFQHKSHTPILNLNDAWNEFKDNSQYKFHLHRQIIEKDLEKKLTEYQIGMDMEDFIPNEDNRKSFLSANSPKKLKNDPMEFIKELIVKIERQESRSQLNKEILSHVKSADEVMMKKKKEKKGLFHSFKTSKRSKVKSKKLKSKDIFRLEKEIIIEQQQAILEQPQSKERQTEPKRISKSEETTSEYEDSSTSWITGSRNQISSQSAITLSSRIQTTAKSISTNS